MKRVPKTELLDTRCYLMDSILHISQREKITALLLSPLGRPWKEQL